MYAAEWLPDMMGMKDTMVLRRMESSGHDSYSIFQAPELAHSPYSYHKGEAFGSCCLIGGRTVPDTDFHWGILDFARTGFSNLTNDPREDIATGLVIHNILEQVP